MRVGILSDTHDRLDRTQQAVSILQDAGAECLVHCGDLTGPAIVGVCAVLPAYFVLGNNDCDEVPTLQKAIAEAGAVCLDWGGEILLAGKHVAVVHGHVGIRQRLASGPDYLLSGHSHVRHDRREGGTRWINPGALHRASEYTVALLDLGNDHLQFLPVS